MRFTRLVVLFGLTGALSLAVVSCGEKGAVSRLAPTAENTEVDNGTLPIVNGLAPPTSTPPDSIVAKAEKFFHGRTADPMSLTISGVSGNTIGNMANSWLNVPYLWGGNSRSGIDCSHLVYQVYQNAGIRSYPFMTTSAMQRYSHFICVNQSSDAGDIILFGSLGHTGIHMGNGWMVDANSYNNKVVWDNIHDAYWSQFHPYIVRYVP